MIPHNKVRGLSLEEGFKALSKRYKNTPCNFHYRLVPDRSKMRCAEKKCHLLWQWRTDFLYLYLDQFVFFCKLLKFEILIKLYYLVNVLNLE